MAPLSKYRLIVGKKPTYNERRAAAFLIEKIKVVTGHAIPVFTDDSPITPYEIIVGGTDRESSLGVSFSRERERLYEYEIRCVDERLFVTGLGTSEDIFKEPYGAYTPVLDCGLGTYYAAMRFCEKVLGYDFTYVSDFDALVDRDADDIMINGDCALLMCEKKLRDERPVLFDGAAMYSVPATSGFDMTRSCFVFKSVSGELIVYDGGRRDDASHVVDVLEYISNGKKPKVSAWLLSQLRPSHSGVLCEICENAALAERVEISDVYCNPMTKKFYTEIGLVKGEKADVLSYDRDIILNVRKYLGATLHTPEARDTVSVGEFSAEVIHTPCDAIKKYEKVTNNDACTVYRIVYNGEQSILLLGDGEKYTARALEALGKELKSDILQIGHHGRASISEKCLRAIDADVYIAQTTNKIWYSEESSSARVYIYRTRRYIREMGKKRENVYRDTEGILSFPLPVRVK